jgi:hypothetical protein
MPFISSVLDAAFAVDLFRSKNRPHEAQRAESPWAMAGTSCWQLVHHMVQRHGSETGNQRSQISAHGYSPTL